MVCALGQAVGLSLGTLGMRLLQLPGLAHSPYPLTSLDLPFFIPVSAAPQGEADSALDIMWRKKVTDGNAA